MFLLPRAKKPNNQQLGSLELLELKQFPTFITLGYIMIWITESCCVLLLLSTTFRATGMDIPDSVLGNYNSKCVKMLSALIFLPL